MNLRRRCLVAICEFYWQEPSSMNWLAVATEASERARTFLSAGVLAATAASRLLAWLRIGPPSESGITDGVKIAAKQFL